MSDQNLGEAAVTEAPPNSTHRVEVIDFPPMETHPNADSLSIVRIFSGYTVVVKTEQWQGVKKAAYIPPDSLVPLDRLEFDFLKDKPYRRDPKYSRIKAIKLRGCVSMGLLIPMSDDSVVGSDVAESLGVLHYNPPEPGSPGAPRVSPAPPPACFVPSPYDLDTWYRYSNLLVDGEEVVVTEKIHGTSARWTFDDGKLHVGARRDWRLDTGHQSNFYWRVIHENPELKAFVEKNPWLIVYGEIYGSGVQDLHYGREQGQISYAVFDLWSKQENRWLTPFEMSEVFASSARPHPAVSTVLYFGPYSKEAIEPLANGKTTMGGDHVREGVVITPINERWNERIGRVKLKLVGSDYMCRKEE